ncbi:MAG: hypothetical protein EP329_18250 [Deltaproteobacteria bacterium]|nr:MAG: hypothetical protein EP329_18250 [Deltaproteobacteria bacterium]
MTRTRLYSLTFAALMIGIALALWLEGSSFYMTHPWDRSMHPGYDALRSGGSWGFAEAIVGTALILLNLTFMLRRRLKAMRRFGALRLWMNMHVVTGLVGPLIVVYHTAFYPRTTVAITAFVSLGVLVLTGVIGRFIYAMVPHTVAGAEMGMGELEARLTEARDHLATVARPDDPLWQKLDQLSRQPLVTPKSSLGCLLLLPYTLVATAGLRLRLWSLRRSRRDVDWHDVYDIVRIRRRLHTLQLYRRLLRWWRALHRVFALVMVVTLTVHVVILMYLGYVPGVGA